MTPDNPSDGVSRTEPMKSCPFCGGMDIRFDKRPGAGKGPEHHGKDVFSMCCYRCGATFPNMYNLLGLLAKWQARAMPSEHVRADLLKPFMPIEVRENQDYAEITFGDHQTQAMTMAPNDWIALSEAYKAAIGH